MVKAFGVAVLSLLSIGALAHPSPVAQPPTKGKTLIVGIEDYADCTGTRGGEDCFNNASNRWFLFTIDTGSTLNGICENLNNFYWKENEKFGDYDSFEGKIGWPHGSWELKIDGIDYTYNNNGETRGALFRTIDGETVKVGSDCKGDLQSVSGLYQWEQCASDSEKIVTRRTIISCDF